MALAPLFVALRGSRLGRALGLGLVFTLVYWASVWNWGPEAVAGYFLQPRWVGFAFLLGTALLMFAPYFLAFTALHHRLSRTRVPCRILLAAAGWVAFELVRSRLFTGSAFFIGNPWAVLGYTQVGVDSLVQIASWTGVYGVSFVVVAANLALAELWLAFRAGSLRQVAASTVLQGALPPLLVVGYGLAELHEAPRTGSVSVAVVQANLSAGARWRSDLYGKHLDTYLELTKEALAGGETALVVWPESAMTFFLEEEPGYQAALGLTLADGGAQLIAGAPRATGEEDRFFNSIYLVTAAGEIAARYDKQVLVPFAEYFPFGRLDVLGREFGRIRQFTPGESPAPLPTRAGPAGVIVCNEAMFPEIARRRVRDGAQLLVNPSNDSWVEHEKFALQQFEIVTLRAVEQRRWLVRASTSGPSAIVDPWGRIQGATEPFTRGVLRGTVEPRTELSVYARVGDLFGFACAAVALGAAAVSGRRRVSRDDGA